MENINKDAYRISRGSLLPAKTPLGKDRDRIAQGLVTWQARPYARTTCIDLAADQAAFAVSGMRVHLEVSDLGQSHECCRSWPEPIRRCEDQR